MSWLSRPNRKHLRHAALFALVAAPALYFAPIPAAFLLACGVLDVSRHRRISYQLVEVFLYGKCVV